MAGESTRYGVKLASHYLPVPGILELAVRAESLGYHSVWTTEGRMAPDSVTLSAAIAARTRRVRIGTSVVNPFTRSPGLLAISAASIDQISGGRFILGVGPGDPASLERQHIEYHRPLTRLREHVTVVRALLAGTTVDFTGETLRISSLALDFTPRQERLPVYIGATGPRALAQAGEIGDAVLLNVGVGGEAVARIAETIPVKLVGTVVVGMHDNREAAVRGTKPIIVTYLTRFPAIARVSGVPEPLLEQLRRARRNGMQAACAALPDHYVHRMAAVGTPDDCREWITRYTAGMDEALLTPAFGDPRAILEELAALLTP